MFAGELQKQKALFAAADGIALAAAFSGALLVYDPSGSLENRLIHSGLTTLVFGVACAAITWILVFRAFDLYRMRNGGLKEAFAVVRACTVAALLTLVALFFAHITFSRVAMAISYAFSIPAVLIVRGIVRMSVRRLYANQKIAIPLAVVGHNPVARYMLDQLLDNMTPYEPVGFLQRGEGGRQYRGYPVFGEPATLSRLAAAYPFLEVAIAMPDASREEQEKIIRLCEEHRVRWWMVPWMLRSLSNGLKVDMIGNVPLIGPRCTNIEGLNYAVKRSFDLLAASILLIIAAPAIALGALAIWLTDGGPVLFRQTRIGIHGQPFELLKLRTMRSAASDNVHREYVRDWIRNGNAAAKNGNGNGHAVFKLANDNRVTGVGRILRRFSIDELPQLVNVVRGEMSLIGPRPALPYELEHYEEWHRRRLDAAPGITGLWQVSGRNRLSFEEMVRLDVQYLEDWSLAGDLKILARTLPALLRGEGV